MPALLCFGMGFCAEALAERRRAAGWRILGTVRSDTRIRELAGRGFDACTLDTLETSGMLREPDLHLLISAPPADTGDPVLAVLADRLRAACPTIAWAGYLSTTGVYGDHQGGWVDEDTPVQPQSERTRRRVQAEQAWLEWGHEAKVPVNVFRLAGIYGPGRNQLVSLREGTARRITKQGQVFSRIHVDDIATVLEAAMERRPASRIFNVCDDEPAAPHEVVAFAAGLLGIAPPPLEDYETARPALSPMAAGFYQESKRVRNERIKQELAIRLAYPTYREGLSALLRTLDTARPA
jgi:nucleoside-diphosphate-sugar epimerase